jgi:hypothetical protein
MISYILVIWLFASSFSPTVLETRYDSLESCELAGTLWEKSQPKSPFSVGMSHHACLPNK